MYDSEYEYGHSYYCRRVRFKNTIPYGNKRPYPLCALVERNLIINGAVDMGMGIPHIGQGWARIDLENTVSSGLT